MRFRVPPGSPQPCLYPSLSFLIYKRRLSVLGRSLSKSPTSHLCECWLLPPHSTTARPPPPHPPVCYSLCLSHLPTPTVQPSPRCRELKRRRKSGSGRKTWRAKLPGGAPGGRALGTWMNLTSETTTISLPKSPESSRLGPAPVSPQTPGP